MPSFGAGPAHPGRAAAAQIDRFLLKWGDGPNPSPILPQPKTLTPPSLAKSIDENQKKKICKTMGQENKKEASNKQMETSDQSIEENKKNMHLEEHGRRKQKRRREV